MKKAAVVFSIIIVILLYNCDGGKNFINKNSEEGYQLASTHCKTCHKFPEANLLDKKTWANYVLPKMAGLLGFMYMDGGTYIEKSEEEIIPLEDWNKIIKYYLSESPDDLETPNKEAIVVGLNLFKPEISKYNLENPTTTYVGILPGKNHLLFADGITENLYWLNQQNTLIDSVEVGVGLVNIQEQGDKIMALTMGVLYPSDERSGKLLAINKTYKTTKIILDSLQRPVFVEFADLNNDSITDILVSEFGNINGGLSWFEGKENNSFKRHVLRSFPGCVRTQIIDFDKDGKPDIIALFAQGDEGFFVFLNQGNGNFKELRIMQFHPSFGSNFFEIVDFNMDGHFDIIATNGDNGDYPAIVKGYHGIRIYLNNGKNQFKEEVFLPVSGASKAIARDFDGDGDLDIASISYFPDYEKTPNESFIYWENKGDLKFQPYSFDQSNIGRWLTMDVKDIDNDGDLDILLGNAKFMFGSVPEDLKEKWNKFSPSTLLLRNTGK